jgi:2-hydroxy-3-keto-5-methylthiopentenyl-1-phosphate phosphatase
LTDAGDDGRDVALSTAFTLLEVEPDALHGVGFGRIGRKEAISLMLWAAGSSWYVERVLSRAGVAATVYSNPGRLENGRGLVLEKPDPSSPYHSASVGLDKSAVVRHALRVAEHCAFAGDGPTDLQPALLVRPGLRFARGFLAEELRARGEVFSRSRAEVRLQENWHEECPD